MPIALEEKQVHTALVSFVFPFSILPETQAQLIANVKREGFKPFFLNDLEQENAYYGEDFRVSHKQMERYYLPFTGNILFPHRENPESFRRYTRAFNLECVLAAKNMETAFKVLSVDIVICPFKLGFLTMRTEIAGSVPFSIALEFTDRLRILEDVSRLDKEAVIRCEGKTFEEVEDFVFHRLANGVLPTLEQSNSEGSYFETLPFFVDERMYVQAFFGMDGQQAVSEVDQFRAVNVDGLSIEGEPLISANNLQFIQDYCARHGYHRWSPRTVYLTNEHTFCCITVNDRAGSVPIAMQMYGEYYYGLLLNLFHKIVLLKLSNIYSHVRMGKDNDKVEALIKSITAFSSKYYFLELVSQSQGRELFLQLRKVFGNDEMFVEVKDTLTDLYKFQDRMADRTQGYLLMILTIFTVISGIYGMNQVIEDLKAPIHWTKLGHYSVFEYLALAITLSGILVGLALAAIIFSQWFKDWRKKRNNPQGF